MPTRKRSKSRSGKRVVKRRSRVKCSSGKKATPVNRSLYSRVKREAQRKFDVWPSAYGSGWLVQEYKRRGGEYRCSGEYMSPNRNSGLDRWFDEQWIDACAWPKRKSCGRSRSMRKNYPYCRPSRRVSSKTPKTVQEMSKSEREKMCRSKRRSPYKRSKSLSMRRKK